MEGSASRALRRQDCSAECGVKATSFIHSFIHSVPLCPTSTRLPPTSLGPRVLARMGPVESQ